MSGKQRGRQAPGTRVLRAALERADDEAADEEELAANERDALTISAEFAGSLDDTDRHLLQKLRTWADNYSGRPDAKARALLELLNDVVRPASPDGQRRSSDERVIVFTEYRDTQRWLVDLLTAHGLGGERLALLYGGMDGELRERTKAVFQAQPSLDPVRILLATDAASEGIDLQRHCHRVVHYDIPWNPNRLEQRNGRIDRHGQRSPEVLIHHFVGSQYQAASRGSLEADLEFLSMVVRKVETIREDLGSAGPVIADQVEERMLGRRRELDEHAIAQASPRGRIARMERDLREQIARLRERLDETIETLHLEPQNVERVVRVALALAHQPDLIPATVPREGPNGEMAEAQVFHLPQLTQTWARALEGLAHPVTGQTRPITFDHRVASGHDDVVLAHLGHRLVQHALWLLRAEIWAADSDASLARLTYRVIPDGIIEEPAVVAHARLVVTGADGRRLHEEIIAAGGLLRDRRFARFTTLAQGKAVIDAPTLGIPSQEWRDRLVDQWSTALDGLKLALTRREQERVESLTNVLARRAEEDEQTVRTTLQDLERSIRAELGSLDRGVQLNLFGDELEQYQRDVEALQRRLAEIPAEIEAEVDAVRRRYADPTPRMFPAAIEFCVPQSKVDRP